ncbi:MAG: hypothetical protein ACJAZX_001532 [Rickettsiales bacterium]|jgi:hypothetical protein
MKPAIQTETTELTDAQIADMTDRQKSGEIKTLLNDLRDKKINSEEAYEYLLRLLVGLSDMKIEGHPNISSEEVIILARALKDNKTLVKFDLDSRMFIAEDFIALAGSLEDNPNLRSFSLTNIIINDSGSRAIARLLEKNPNLKSIALSGDSSGSRLDTKLIVRALKDNQALEMLRLSFCPLDDEVVEVLVDALKENNSLRSIALFPGTRMALKISDRGAKNLTLLLPKNPNLEHIGLDGNNIGDQGLIELLSAMEHNPSLALKIDFGNNPIGSEGIKTWVKFLKDKKLLPAEFKISSCDIGSKGAEELLSLLKDDQVVKDLTFYNNRIGDEGAKIIASFLKTDQTLTGIKIQINQIGEGAIEIMEAVQSNTSLISLNMLHNKINDEHAVLMAESLEKNTSLEQLNLGYNSIGDTGLIALAKALEKNKTLKSFTIGRSYDKNEVAITDIGARAILEILEKRLNTTITELVIEGSQISPEILGRIRICLKDNQRLAKQPESANPNPPERKVSFAKAPELPPKKATKAVIQEEEIPTAPKRRNTLIQLDHLQEQLDLAKEESEKNAAENATLRQELESSKQKQLRNSQVVSKEEFAKMYQELQALRQEVREANPNGQFQELEERMVEMGNVVESTVRRVSVGDKKAILSAEENAKLTIKVEALTGLYHQLVEEENKQQESVQMGVAVEEEAINPSPADTKKMMELVQGAQDLFEAHTVTSLTTIANLHIEGQKQQEEIETSTQNESAQKYYLDTIRLLNGVYTAALSVKSGWVNVGKGGKIGTFGTILKMAGGFSPVAGSAITTAGELTQILGQKLQKDNLIKLVDLFDGKPDAMDKVATAVALALVKLGKTSETGKEFTADVAKMMSAVFEGKITKDHDLARAFVQAARGLDISAPRLARPQTDRREVADVTSRINPNSAIGQRRSSKLQSQRLITNPEELHKEAGLKFNDVFKDIEDGLTSLDGRSALSRNLKASIQGEAIAIPRFGQFFVMKTTETDFTIPEEKMSELLKQALTTKGILGEDGKINPEKNNPIQAKEVAQIFASSLLKLKDKSAEVAAPLLKKAEHQQGGG